jgi:hypothetical protein
LEEGTPPALTASKTGTIPLSFATKDQEAVKLSWTNPAYKFTTGVSSQNVSYLVEIDTTGANFSNPNKKVITVSNDVALSITQNDLNDYLLNQLQLIPGSSHNIEMRVTSNLVGGTGTLRSNVLKFAVTPYSIPPKVEAPTNGNLWLLGDATANGWSNPMNAPYTTSQKFTKVSNTLYQITVALPGGGNYKLIQEQGNWSTQYHMLAGGTWEGGDFEKRDADPGFPGPPSAGNYKITVDFQRGKFSVVKL